MLTPEILLLGGPNSGKTHYAGQLYGRLRRKPGELALRTAGGTPADLSALDEVLECLEDGRAANHTSTNTWDEILLPLVDKQGRNIDLRWPDYGGEQLNSVFDQREIPEKWRSRLVEAESWMVLIRLESETTFDDALNTLNIRPNSVATPSARPNTWDANAKWVELFQLLLHVSGVGYRYRVRKPRLAILLSCYDEINNQENQPCDVLDAYLPLFSSFVKSNWAAKEVSIWGLSSLGVPLNSEDTNEDFVDDGPEEQGWIISPDGKKDEDLSKPLSWLLGE
ncbi:MAG: hypothetical protein OEZ39_14690 [Gammaproteobacteria bacterium]|nr:hypothetical protein [Gammaproteobacteria bacterium]MDH5653101.1 hypothetical protein [Gammaproteobacteria bacterium]